MTSAWAAVLELRRGSDVRDVVEHDDGDRFRWSGDEVSGIAFDLTSAVRAAAEDLLSGGAERVDVEWDESEHVTFRDDLDVAEGLTGLGLHLVRIGEWEWDVGGEPFPLRPQHYVEWRTVAEVDWDPDRIGGARHEIVGRIGDRWFYVETENGDCSLLGTFRSTEEALRAAAGASALFEYDPASRSLAPRSDVYDE